MRRCGRVSSNCDIANTLDLTVASAGWFVCIVVNVGKVRCPGLLDCALMTLHNARQIVSSGRVVGNWEITPVLPFPGYVPIDGDPGIRCDEVQCCTSESFRVRLRACPILRESSSKLPLELRCASASQRGLYIPPFSCFGSMRTSLMSTR